MDDDGINHTRLAQEEIQRRKGAEEVVLSMLPTNVAGRMNLLGNGFMQPDANIQISFEDEN